MAQHSVENTAGATVASLAEECMFLLQHKSLGGDTHIHFPSIFPAINKVQIIICVTSGEAITFNTPQLFPSNQIHSFTTLNRVYGLI